MPTAPSSRSSSLISVGPQAPASNFRLAIVGPPEFDYQYVDLGLKTYNNFTLDEMRPAGSSRFAPQVHAFTLGLNYRPSARPLPADRWPGVDWENWSVHGQATYIEQGYRRFNSPYEGPNSLSGDSQINNTITATAFIGRKLWDGGEFYINPDFAQGFGLSSTFGLAGFPNGEAQKSNFPVPRGNIGRLFLRQTFGFGGEQETIEDGPNQIAGKQDISRLTVSVGKFAVNDFFNGNSYAADPRTTFLNWNIWGGGSWDITMDQPGWTWGASADFNQKDWAFRAGYFLLPIVSNDNVFDTHIPQRGEYIAELELRYSLFSQPGKLRLTGWINRGTMGGYLDALNLPMSEPDYPDIAQTRRVRTNYGFIANLEQAITTDLGIFSRASWSPGHVEIIGWTDVDQSLSFGAVLKGTAWGRPDDRVGVAGVDRRTVLRGPGILRRRRARHPDRRRRAQLPHRTRARGLLCDFARQMGDADARLSVFRQSGLQRRPRAGFGLFQPSSFGILVRDVACRRVSGLYLHAGRLPWMPGKAPER